MADELFYLTGKDVGVLRPVVEGERQRPNNTTQRPDLSPEDTTAPEVYVVRIGAGGIAALNTATLRPGSTLCTVYQLVDVNGVGTLHLITGLTVKVYNLAAVPLAAQRIILATRDKYGRWYSMCQECTIAPVIPEPGTSTSPGPGNLPEQVTLTYSVGSCGSGCMEAGDSIEMDLMTGEGFDPFYQVNFTPQGCSPGNVVTITLYQSDPDSDQWYLQMDLNSNGINNSGPYTQSPGDLFSLNLGLVDLFNSAAICEGGLNMIVEE